jgi:hypothetical protein
MIPWWTDQEAGLIGGISGSVLGVLGGVFGSIAGICVPKGKCKGLVYGLATFMIGVGIISLIAGVAASLFDQPYSVYYPLLIIGIVCTLCMGCVMPSIRHRYREADHRRLEAEEFRRS